MFLGENSQGIKKNMLRLWMEKKFGFLEQQQVGRWCGFHLRLRCFRDRCCYFV